MVGGGGAVNREKTGSTQKRMDKWREMEKEGSRAQRLKKQRQKQLKSLCLSNQWKLVENCAAVRSLMVSDM